jgi:hypothetical protein
MKKCTLALAIAGTFTTVILLGASHSHAQFNFLDKAKSAIGGVTGGEKSSDSGGLSVGDISLGLRDALKIGTECVVGTLGKSDGFNSDPSIHIPLPDNLKKVQSALSAVGYGSLGEDLELKLNRAAETATPIAKDLFLDAITKMTLDDAKNILNGPEDAATRYFEGKMTPSLQTSMRPIIDQTLSQVGAVQSYDKMVGQYSNLPFVPDVKNNLTTYALEKALSGIFFYLAKEEKGIRENPAKRTTDILSKVFGGR